MKVADLEDHLEPLASPPSAPSYRPSQGCSMKVAVVLGTRPEAIKLAPVIEDLRRDPERVTCIVVNTGQHRDMAIQALAAFGLRHDVVLGTMRVGRSLGGIK